MAILQNKVISNPSPQLQAVLRWLDAMITTHDVKDLEASITDDFTHQVLPMSLGRPTRGREDFLAYADAFLLRVVKDFVVRTNPKTEHDRLLTACS